LDVDSVRVGPRKHVLDGGTHWLNLANTTEPSICGGDAAFLSNYFDHLILLFWSPYVIRQTIIFLPCGLYLSFFLFPRLISAVGDWIPYFHTWCGLSADLECMSEMCCTRLAENTERKKIAILAPSHNFVGLYLRS